MLHVTGVRDSSTTIGGRSSDCARTSRFQLFDLDSTGGVSVTGMGSNTLVYGLLRHGSGTQDTVKSSGIERADLLDLGGAVLDIFEADLRGRPALTLCASILRLPNENLTGWSVGMDSPATVRPHSRRHAV